MVAGIWAEASSAGEFVGCRFGPHRFGIARRPFRRLALLSEFGDLTRSSPMPPLLVAFLATLPAGSSSSVCLGLSRLVEVPRDSAPLPEVISGSTAGAAGRPGDHKLFGPVLLAMASGPNLPLGSDDGTTRCPWESTEKPKPLPLGSRWRWLTAADEEESWSLGDQSWPAPFAEGPDGEGVPPFWLSSFHWIHAVSESELVMRAVTASWAGRCRGCQTHGEALTSGRRQARTQKCLQACPCQMQARNSRGLHQGDAGCLSPLGRCWKECRVSP